MSVTNSTGDGIMRCDKCGRQIEIGKGYLSINGWIICGICQWESDQRNYPKPFTIPEEPKKEFNSQL